MKKIEWIWNLVHYNVFKIDNKLRKLLNYLNPFYLINNIPAIKKHHAEHGVADMNNFANSIFYNPKTGLSSITAGSFMGCLIVLVEYGLFNLIQGITKISFINYVFNNTFYFIIFFVLLFIPVIIINQYLLFRKDKYLI